MHCQGEGSSDVVPSCGDLYEYFQKTLADRCRCTAQSDVTVFRSTSGTDATIPGWLKKMATMILPTATFFGHIMLWILVSGSQLQNQVSASDTRLNVEDFPFRNAFEEVAAKLNTGVLLILHRQP